MDISIPLPQVPIKMFVGTAAIIIPISFIVLIHRKEIARFIFKMIPGFFLRHKTYFLYSTLVSFLGFGISLLVGWSWGQSIIASFAIFLLTLPVLEDGYDF